MADIKQVIIHSGPLEDSNTQDETKSSQTKPTKRRAHDIIWLVLFLLATIGFIIVAIFSFIYGSLISGQDSEGNFCGAGIGKDSSRDLIGQPYLYYFDPSNIYSYHLCVKECPKSSRRPTICKYDVPESLNQNPSDFINGKCTFTIDSTSIYQRCIPSLIADYISESVQGKHANESMNSTLTSWSNAMSSELNARTTASKIFQDISPYWWIIFVSCIISMILSLIWLYTLRFTASILVGVTILLLLISSWGITIFLGYGYYSQKVLHQAIVKTGVQMLDNIIYNEWVLLFLIFITGGIASVFSIIFCCLARSIKVSLVIIREASKCLKAIPFIVFFPFVKTIFLLVLTCLSVIVVLLLATSGDVIASNISSKINSTSTDTMGTSYQPNITHNWLIAYVVFWFLWASALVSALVYCSVSGAASRWYWSKDKKIGNFVVMKSLGKILYYNIGSLVLGSFLISSIKFVRIVLYFIQKGSKADKNKCAKWICACCQCCLGCIKMIVEVLNKNAYILIGIYGESFCKSAKEAARVVLGNLIRFSTILWVVAFINSAGKMLIMFLSGFSCIGLYLQYASKDIFTTHFAIILTLVLLFSYLIADVFFSVFKSSIDTIFISFCEDCVKNDGGPSRPYYMSDELKKFNDIHKDKVPVVQGF